MLVGGWATPLKNMSSSVGMVIIPYGKLQKPCSKPPTSIYSTCLEYLPHFSLEMTQSCRWQIVQTWIWELNFAQPITKQLGITWNTTNRWLHSKSPLRKTITSFINVVFGNAQWTFYKTCWFFAKSWWLRPKTSSALTAGTERLRWLRFQTRTIEYHRIISDSIFSFSKNPHTLW